MGPDWKAHEYHESISVSLLHLFCIMLMGLAAINSSAGGRMNFAERVLSHSHTLRRRGIHDKLSNAPNRA